MDVQTFSELVRAHPDLEPIGICGDRFIVKRRKPPELTTSIPRATVVAEPWEVLEPVLVGTREPLAMHHITRVCGYYSRVENWNESKRAEREARNKGDYKVE
jgi:hypothetical protein